MKKNDNTTSSGTNPVFNTDKTWIGEYQYINDLNINSNPYITNPFYDQNQVYGPASCINAPYDLGFLFSTNTNLECYILHNNNRLKKYPSKSLSGKSLIYLNDKSEFEIEMFNPNTFTVGVKIKLNGEYISNAHLVLYPGQKLKLDRYLDENKKFLFHTYEVENTKQVTDAIKNNGLVQLEFYKEYKKPVQQYTRTRGFNHNPNILYSHNANDVIGNDITFSTMSFNDVSGEITLNSLETGIIGKGNESDTEFTDVDINFESYTFTTDVFQILPLSQKPVEAKDLVKHCTNCGKKAKKDHKFCASCGTQL